MKKRIFAVCAVFVLLAGIGAAVNAESLLDYFRKGKQDQEVTISREEYERLQRWAKLEEVYEYIDQYYYKEPDEELMREYAIRGMLASLDDPYTFYYNEAEWSDMWADDEGEYGGIGIQLLGNYEDNTVFITRVFKDTPAEHAGLRKGDQLVRVEDIEVDASTMQYAVSVMRGETDEEVEIEVIRGGENIVFRIGRAVIHINRIDSMMLENNVGYIVLYEFAGDCAEKLEEALKELEKEGAQALILDVRDNGGGWVDDAVSIADLFLDRQLFFYEADRYGAQKKHWTSKGKTDIPLVILVNENSASSSEILSGGLQEAGRAKLVGVQTYGKGIMQWVPSLGDGEDGFQFTYAQYYFPSGKEVHGIGITPDIEAAYPEELGTYLELGDMTDPQLKTAWEEAVKMINR